MTDRRFFCSLLGLTILLSEAIELLRNSSGPVTPLIRRCISWCREFRDHKEQTQSIHQAVIRALRYTDGVKIGYPAHLRKGMGKDNPGNTCTVRRAVPLGSALGWHNSSQLGITRFRQTVFPLIYFSVTRGRKNYMKRKYFIGKNALVLQLWKSRT